MSHYELPREFVVRKSYSKPMTSVVDHGFHAVLVEDVYEPESNCCNQYVLAHNYHDDGDVFMFFKMNVDKINHKIQLLNTLAYNFSSFEENTHYDHFDQMECWMKRDMRAIFQCLIPCDYILITYNDQPMDIPMLDLLCVPPHDFVECQLYIQKTFIQNMKSRL
jgi:hypothetical protein